MSQDTLSEVLRAVRLRGAVFFDVSGHSDWAAEAPPAKDLAPEVSARLQRTAKRIYRTLKLDGYARIDFRLSADGTPYFIEANPNPEIAKSQEFATAARHEDLITRTCCIASWP